ncbi:Protein of unknown function (DUF1212) [Seminavis robusta]|uniref:Threonine/serine exporter-like N-terminal domain-containing protein n=1 Tax=Seminavis robusta TaxID=568900 RepID=A0A9N8E3K2_9STRA|nr:Protein of unknown function (DUF1212) [Seminavis robusta]|eukprot:Sro618_g176230.1 Protein of unknown function (DUF1212) (468) ;mRNA; f:24669-26167
MEGDGIEVDDVEARRKDEPQDSDTLNGGGGEGEKMPLTLPQSSTLEEGLATVEGDDATQNEVDLSSTTQFCIRIGQAAFLYGSPGTNVERFLEHIMKQYGFYGMFRSTQSELFCSVAESETETPQTTMVPIVCALDMYKLALLADLANKVLSEEVTQKASLIELDKIAKTRKLWGNPVINATRVVAGAAIANLLGGSWWDILISGCGSCVCSLTVMILPKIGNHGAFAQYIQFVAAFVTASFANLVKLGLADLNVLICTTSAIITLTPGFKVSVGVAEIVSDRIVSGLAKLAKGFIVLLWLVVGAWLGISFIDAVANVPSNENKTVPLPMAWHALFVPLACVCLIFVFQVGTRDAPWALLIEGVTYGSNYGFSKLKDKNLGVFLSTVVLVVIANGWAKLMNRPASLVLVPSLVLQVSGSIGFQGLFHVIEGQAELGTAQFEQMLIIALMIVVGLLAGNTVLPPGTTL